MIVASGLVSRDTRAHARLASSLTCATRGIIGGSKFCAEELKLTLSEHLKTNQIT